MSKILYEDEIDLKKKLDSVGVRYGENDRNFSFVVTFVDNKSNCVLAARVHSTPIAAIRDLADVIKASGYPAADIDIVLDVAFDSDSAYRFTDIKLSPYLYYKKQELKPSESEKKD